MATIAQLTARLASIDASIASGVLTVTHGETTTTFRNLKDMMAARAFIKKQIDEAEGTSRRRVRYPYQSGKGL